MKITLAEIAKLTGSELDGDPDYVIEDAAGVEEAGENQISFLENPKYASRVSSSKAGGIFLSKDVNGIKGGPKNKLFTDRPKWAYGEVLKKIYAEKWPSEAVVISDKAEIHFEARLGKDVSVGAFAVIKGRTLIGKNTKIAAQCHIGYNARIGEDCVLHPQVVIGDFCELGDRVEVHPGSIIGGEGYAYWTDKKTGVHHKIPQVGRVVLENDVEVGSNVTIDRAATGETRIGEGTKIDNLVQIGHNVSIGRNGLVISQVGDFGLHQGRKPGHLRGSSRNYRTSHYRRRRHHHRPNGGYGRRETGRNSIRIPRPPSQRSHEAASYFFEAPRHLPLF